MGGLFYGTGALDMEEATMDAREGGAGRVLGGGAGTDGDPGMGEPPIDESLADGGEGRAHRQYAAAKSSGHVISSFRVGGVAGEIGDGSYPC